jgi:phosphoribosylglycinamide formyltransferase-1
LITCLVLVNLAEILDKILTHKVAIFASGSGSNAQKIIEYFSGRKDIEIALVLTNNAKAKIVERADNLNIPCVIFNKIDFFESDSVIKKLQECKINFIVLAGFLWLVPLNLIKAFPNKIINIHPALLPKYGGKGMYGNHIHKAIVENKETETGISIHEVNEHFDEGKIIFQAKCIIDSNDTPEMVAEKVHELEHEHYPKIIEKYLLQLNTEY